MDINWNGLKPQNVFASFADGREAGTEARKTKLKQEALNVFAKDPAKAEQMMLEAGEFQSAEAMRKRREAQSQKNTRGLINVVAQTKGPAAAQTKAMQVGEPEISKMYGELDENQRKQASERAGVLVAYLDSFAGKPEAEIVAQLQQDAPALTELGFTEEQIRSFQPTPANIARMRAQALGLKGHLDQANKDRTFGLQQEQFGETKRRNRATESISRGQLGVAQSNSARGWAAHNERKRAGGYGTPGVGGSGIVPDEDVEVDQ